MVNSRDKGKRRELELCKLLRETFPECNARRGQQFKGTPDSPDVVHDINGIHIECKGVERLNVPKAMEKAIEDAGIQLPIVCHIQNRSEWLVTMRLKDVPMFTYKIAKFLEWL